MKYTIWGIALIFGILFVSLASAWNMTTFNNSLTNENITLSAGIPINRYLAVPSSVLNLLNGTLNLMYAGTTFPYSTTNLISYYKLDEPSGTLVIDSFGTNNGTNNDSILGSLGISNTAYNFSNNGLGINVTNPKWSFKTYNFTVNLWINPSTLAAGTQGLITAGTNGWALYNNGAPALGFGKPGVSGIAFSYGIALKKWQMITIVYWNDSFSHGNFASLYINGTLNQTISYNESFLNTSLGYIGSTGGANTGWNGTIDEIGIWNRSLSSAEISALYNFVQLTTANFTNFSIGNVQIDTEAIGTSTNVTKTITGLHTAINSYLTTCSYIGGFCYVPFVFQSTIPTIMGYSNMEFDNLGFTENSQSYNATTYETSTETFSINLNYSTDNSITGTLYYDGTPYAGTRTGIGSNAIFTKTLDIPTVTSQTNKTFYWQIVLGGAAYYNSTNHTQTINNISFSICGDSGGTIKYLNVTVKDETTQASINATIPTFLWTGYLGSGLYTKTYNFLNSSTNAGYAFCFSPSDRTIHSTISMTYASPGYPTRPYTVTSDFTNITTNTTLYLLNSADGIYSSIQVIQQSGGIVSGASILVERQINNVWTMVGQAVTDSSGLATFWVNPNYNHRYTVSKAGYVTAQVTIKPTQSLYTLALGNVQGTAGYNDQLSGISWFVHPAPGMVNNIGATSFNVSVNANLANLVSCIFNIVNQTNYTQTLVTTSGITNSTSCLLNINYILKPNQKIFGQLGIRTTNTTGYVYVDTDWAYYNMPLNLSYNNNTITSFFRELQNTNEFGSGNQAEFSRVMWFFLLMTIFIGIFTFYTGAELTNPGAVLIVVFVIVLLASMAGFLSFNNSNSNIDPLVGQYGFAFLLGELVTSYILVNFRRVSYG